MAYLDFLAPLHRATTRDYLERVCRHDKAACAEVARRFDSDYWDGERRFGYGGYRYDGRWRPVARDLAAHYGLKPGDRVLDVGCGKAHLLYEMTRVVPGLRAVGVDISAYALAHPGWPGPGDERLGPGRVRGSATALPFPDGSFDLVLSVATLHNLYLFDLERAVSEIGRVGRGRAWVVVESYRTEREKANLLAWQLTCECFFTPAEWEWVFRRFGYAGDHAFLFFE